MIYITLWLALSTYCFWQTVNILKNSEAGLIEEVIKAIEANVKKSPGIKIPIVIILIAALPIAGAVMLVLDILTLIVKTLR